MPVAATAVKEKVMPKEKFHIIKFSPKRTADEVNLITVHVGSGSPDACQYGEHFVMKRQELIPVPDYVVEALNHSDYEIRRQTLSETNKGEIVIIKEPVVQFPREIVYRNIPKKVYLAVRDIVRAKGKVTDEEVQALLDIVKEEG